MPTPTSWSFTDAAHDEQFQVAVVDNTSRNLSMRIIRISSGASLASAALDPSGSGSITYSDGSSATVTGWTLGD